MEKKVEIISKQLIKPSVCHVESFNMSALDQLAPPTYYPIFLYYPNDQESTNLSTRSLQLKSSLSKILADFYPFAGRLINNNTSISCNNSKDDDFGVLFIEAFAHNYNLHEILLSGSKTNTLGQFVPSMDSLLKTHLLIVQVTVFECGGMILGCLVSHKLSDATSICTFINNWAAAARGANNSNSLTPDFTSGVKVFPPTKQPPPLPFANPVGGQEKQIITKIFSFDGPSIADLKSKALSKDVPGPTRVEAVSALIWKCATVSSKSSTSTSTLSHVVNARKRLVPSLPSGTIGNFLAFFVATKSNEGDKNDLSNLVTILRKGLLEFPSLNWDVALDQIVENWNMLGDLISRNNGTELYNISSWCGVPFYEADFGWGKPKWISTMFQHKNSIVLMDAKDGGIEAWVSLEEWSASLFMAVSGANLDFGGKEFWIPYTNTWSSRQKHGSKWY
ncbi:stemmadenine O-acetyltransferase-like isoform X2 [Lycium barbarum]|uniref:stemmadenine O-acetyltransferase-like isoform X2 n=1 Tax=Lycium barbarum TaxID=112863 RepID=UPI00293EA65A|nr:stemmadenine O-acetyltransferase-like isoform X2 [Lycium barbarum]